jgi:hypothetical protein
LLWHEFFASGRAFLPPRMKAALIIDREKWTWQEYEQQPQWLIAMLLTMLHNEAEEANRKAKQS